MVVLEVIGVTAELSDMRYDVVVIGGGPAGLNGALMLARSRRSVVVIDDGAPRNAPAAAVHGLFARDGTPPAELYERGRAEVRSYGGEVAYGTVVAVTRELDELVVELDDGRRVVARRVLAATGLVDQLPEISGLRAPWGRDVVHCPYCHGWEVRDRAIGVLATGPMAMHQALLFRQLTDDLTLFTHTAPPLDEEDLAKLAARSIEVVNGEVRGIVTVNDRIVGVRLRDGTVIAREVLTVASRMVPRAEFLASLGLRPIAHPSGLGDYIPADPTGRTDAPGVWVAGNVTDLSAQVGAAAAAGAATAAQINADLVEEDTQRALEVTSGRGQVGVPLK
jgi:thioredoxin reductase